MRPIIDIKPIPLTGETKAPRIWDYSPTLSADGKYPECPVHLAMTCVSYTDVGTEWWRCLACGLGAAVTRGPMIEESTAPTPGPWAVSAHGEGRTVAIGTEGMAPSLMVSPTLSIEPSTTFAANVKLITLAPQMVDALRSVSDLLGSGLTERLQVQLCQMEVDDLLAEIAHEPTAGSPSAPDAPEGS